LTLLDHKGNSLQTWGS